MMQFVDISAYNSIDWTAYRTWSSVIALKSSEGIGYTDPTFVSHRSGALAAGISTILYYHFARPDTGNDPVNEANWQYQVVGAIRAQDLIVLDFEVEDAKATAEWAYQFLLQQQRNYGKLPALYSSDAYIRERLQDSRLAAYPLWLADWTFDAAARPACPPPWAHYIGLQYTDRAISIPGIAGPVDADVFLGGIMSGVPTGWTYDQQTKKLHAPNGVEVADGFAQWILAHDWDPGNWPLMAAQGLNPVEQGNPSLGGGTVQPFRLCILAWTAKTGVYVMWAGQEYIALYQLWQKALGELHTAQNQIAALQQQLTQAQNATLADYQNRLNQIYQIARVVQQ